MATFYELLTQRNRPVESIFAATDTAEENRLKECAAATKIQAMARMHAARTRYLYLRRCIVDIQRVYRGYRGKVRFLTRAIEVDEARRMAIFHHFASVIQSRFRGFHCRKWHSDFYAQKQYVMQVAEASEAVRQQAIRAQALNGEERKTAEYESQKKAYMDAMSNMHHLLSTAARSGILRPGACRSGLQTMFNTNVEEDLRSMPIPRKKLKEHLAMATSATTEDRLSTSVPYNAVEEARKLMAKVDEKLISSVHGETSFLVRKPDVPRWPQTLQAQSDYVPVSTLRTNRRS